MADSPEEIRKHLKLYWAIGGILLVFTLITVIVAQFHLGTHGNNIIVGLAIAAFKMSLVVLIFMHLKGEKLMIYKFLLFTVIFVIGLFFLTYLHHLDPIPNPWTDLGPPVKSLTRP
ncbi:hypothetical protein BH23VER1_BH23VER1_31390 [soil metagenome]